MRHYIYGAGGHGKVILDAMQLSDLDCTGFIDDGDISTWVGLNVQPLANLDVSEEVNIHLAIGNGKVREGIVNALVKARFFSVYHPSAVIANTAQIGVGSFVAALAVAGPDTKIGNHCIINHAAVVDHDCVVGDFVHIAPQVSLGGASRIGKGVLIGAGAVVTPGIEVGDYAIVGAGAVVTKNVSAGVTVVGNPAKKR